jgi:hypothetical protein
LKRNCNNYLAENEKCIRNQDVVEDAEHKEGSPAQIVDGMGCYLREHEVEQPLSGSTDSNTKLTDASGEDLAKVQP